MAKTFCIAVLMLGFGITGHGARPEIVPEQNIIKPYRGIAYTEKDVPLVRQLVLEGKNAQLVEDIFRVTEEWMSRSKEQILALVPKPNDVFAYGAAGDPKTGQEWPRFGRSGDMCSLERPGQVRSPHTGDIYGIQKPGEQYYDKGDGWTRPEDGRRFFFKGVWNSFVVDSMHDGIDNMALAYLLTGDPSIAEKALFMLDQLAALRVRMPIAGYAVADWPHSTAKDFKKGFFRYMGNIANQRVINSILALDLLGRAPFASTPSSYAGKGGSKKTVFENIASNYFDIYEEAYLESGALTNHATILIGNLLAQGVFFGHPAHLKQGIDGTYAFLDNTINRDGDYIEVSGGYGRLGRDYGGRMIALLAHYRPENYPNAAELPSPSNYPYELRFGNDPRWYRTAVEMLYRLPVMGRFPQFGDMAGDRSVLLNRDNEWLAKSRSQYLRMLYQQTSREEWKREIEIRYSKAAKQKQSPLQIEDLLLYGVSQWAEPPAPGETSAIAETSELIGGKGMAILRSGEGRNKRALFMRGGINSYHGHDDQMALVPYGNGMVLQGEYGYKWAGTPDHLGWGSRAVGHLTAVVNEDLPSPYLFKGYNASTPAPAASVTGFLGRSPAQFVEMQNPGLWARAGLTDYRRTAWLVDVDETRYYFVDFFQIIGGKTHDYVWNSPFSTSQEEGTFQVDGVNPIPGKGVWTLASLSGAHRSKPWNQPGQSWGERLDGAGGKVTPLPGEKELPTTKWNPEPGNGYGMIWDVKAETTTRDWQATWRLADNRHFLKAHLLNYDGMTAVTGKAPTVERGKHFNTIIGRRTADSRALHSRFANVIQVGEPESWPLTKIERLETSASIEPKDAMALRVEMNNGNSDLIVASRQFQEVRSSNAVMIGRNAFVRVDATGAVTNVALQEGTLLESGGWKVEATASAFHAKVLSVEAGEEKSTLTVEGELPAGTALSGAMLQISGGKDAPVATVNNEYYSVETIERRSVEQSTFVFSRQSLVDGYFHVKNVMPGAQKVNLLWRNEVAGLPGSFAYQGKGLIPATEVEGRPIAAIKRVAGTEVELTTVNGIAAGQKLKALAAKPGDDVSMPLTVTLARMENGEYHLHTNGEITVTIPATPNARLFASARGEAAKELAQADSAGKLVTVVSPQSFGSGDIVLRIE